MDFSNRDSQSENVEPSEHPVSSLNSTTSGNSRKDNRTGRPRYVRLTVTALLFYLIAVVVLVSSVLIALGLSGPKPEDSYVDTSKLQAVFLQTGQVYFGNIKSLNAKYLTLDNIYYLSTSNASSAKNAKSTSLPLVKLGCESYAPYDQMVINISQVTFWENLQSSSQVATAVAAFQTSNPNGQTCSDQTAPGASYLQGTTMATPTATAATTTTTSKQ